MPPIKVMFVAPSLGGGGAERVITILLRRLERGRFLPSLVLFRREGAYLSDLPPDVPVFDCGRYGDGGRYRWIGRLVRLLREKPPDVLVSFLWETSLISIPAAFFAGTRRVVVSERLSIRGAREGLLKDIVRRFSIVALYRTVDRIIPNALAMERQLVEDFHLPVRKIVTIPNPVEVEAIIGKGTEPDPQGIRGIRVPVIAAMGRLSPQKGFDILLKAFALLEKDCRLLLMGEGEEEKTLKELAGRLGIAERVLFTGFLANPYPALAGATLFVLSSRFEGFPNALVEAMVLGLPCISMRCPTGPEEIISDGESGVLVPLGDPESLASAIDRLLGDSALRGRLGSRGKERAMEYEAAAIVRRYESLIESVVA